MYFPPSLLLPTPQRADRHSPSPPTVDDINRALSFRDLLRKPLASDLTELAVSWVYETWHAEVIAGETCYFVRDIATRKPDRDSYETSEDVIRRSFHQKLRILGDKFKNFDQEILGAAAAIIDPRGDPYHYLDPILRLVKAYYDYGIPVRSPAAWDSEGRITSFSYLDDPLNSEGLRGSLSPESP
ncbi:hypothetical protein BKA70DRAFT_1418383 [Coprinopsis sp. MPI-PUGE-AT-0042]|nr:hypothetical protein BKA70DRAFT_1418383 [Coprinopsis sp. MPI-PUGE-AT-0042]